MKSPARGTTKKQSKNSASRRIDKPRRVNLALQGGGSHGAFTWGVLDALLEDGRFEFEAVTGASAGAMNAIVMADGWRDGERARRDPRESARAALTDFWHSIAAYPNLFSLAAAWSSELPQGLWSNPVFLWAELLTRVYSPYELNPFDFNPLRRVLQGRIQFDQLRAHAPFKLFVCATNVRTGRPRIFREHEIELDMLLASACLPFAFQAVEVKGEHYWDGGYMGNPALYPLFYSTQALDLVLVQINPLRRDDLPDTAREIIDRAAEISFNASLLHEMRAIEFVQRLLREKRVDPKHYHRVYLHMIAAEDRLKTFGASSKYDTSRAFLDELFALGRTAAREWIDAKFDYLGHAGTVRIAETFL